ncbi:hypothetical protein ZWY2020_004910 [Hordeum vulgare]|nr:hypothetical protein ZWY2020_004910 [Hordeum vulgare]
MPGAAAPQPTAAGNNEASGPGKTLAQAMADLVAEMAKLTTITVTAENQEQVNAELAKLREEMAKIERDIEGEAARMATQHAQIVAETERLSVEGWRLE